MIPAYQGNLEVVKLFIEKGADVDAKNEKGETALMFATMGRAEVVHYLKEHGAK